MKSIESEKETLVKIMKGIARHFGNNCEVVLHDLEKDYDHTSLAIENGHVTNRSPGSPITSHGLQIMQGVKPAVDQYNYINQAQNGKLLRSTSIYLHNDDGKLIGSLCINQDLTDFMVVSKLVKEFTAFNEPVEEDHAAHQEVFAYDISEVMEAMVQSELDTVRIPTAYMQKEDKRAIVERLKAKGIFDIKGSVEYVAERLGVTNFTIYNYLKEVRCTQR